MDSIKKEQNNLNDRAPFITNAMKVKLSDSELIAKYKEFRDFIYDLPFDSMEVTRQEHEYLKRSRYLKLLPLIKGVTVLNEERLSKEVLNDSKGKIFVANHIGSYDQFYSLSFLDKVAMHYFVKMKVTEWPIRWNLIYKPTGVIVVKNKGENNMTDLNYIQNYSAQLLLHGRNLAIYPEGSRKGENNFGGFDRNVVELAQKTGSIIFPYAGINLSKVASFSRPIFALGEPFKVCIRENTKAAIKRLEDVVSELIEECREEDKKRKCLIMRQKKG